MIKLKTTEQYFIRKHLMFIYHNLPRQNLCVVVLSSLLVKFLQLIRPQ